jgi:serine phosphatase RsbU (regulator of sigma subunit)
LEELKNDFPDSKSLVTHLNNQIKAGESSTSSLNLVYGILDRTNLSFEYCTAGPLRPLLWRNSKLITLSQDSNPPVGQLKNHPYHQNVFQLLPGDLLLFNTNGLEAPFKARGLSLLEGISNAFASIQGNDPFLFQNELLAQINRYKESEEELPDDITLIQVAVDNKAIYLAQSK